MFSSQTYFYIALSVIYIAATLMMTYSFSTASAKRVEREWETRVANEVFERCTDNLETLVVDQVVDCMAKARAFAIEVKDQI